MRYIICDADIGVQIRYVHSAYMLYKYTYYSMIWVYAMHYAYRLWLSTNILFRFCAQAQAYIPIRSIPHQSIRIIIYV